MKIDRPIPSTGQWFKRHNKGGSGNAARYADRPTDLVQIGEVDHARREFEVLRVDGFGAQGEPIIGRRTKVSFETWADEGGRRYEPTEAPKFEPAEGPAPSRSDIEASIRDAASLSSTERLVLLTIAAHMEPSGKSSRSMPFLAGQCGLTPRTIERTTGALAAKGWLSIESGAAGGSANVYTITPRPDPDGAPPVADPQEETLRDMVTDHGRKLDEILALLRGRGVCGGQLPLPTVGR